MYHIAVLTNSETQEAFYIEQLSRFCFERGLFPKMDCYRGQELFFDVARINAPTCTVIALPGVAGLIIWCSDLDFSLHAFRLRVDYFLLEPITEEAFQQGLSTWSDGKKTSALFRADHNKHNNEEDY